MAPACLRFSGGRPAAPEGGRVWHGQVARHRQAFYKPYEQTMQGSVSAWTGGQRGRCGRDTANVELRHRWHNHLNPHVSKHEWTDDEDFIVCEFFKRFGKYWAFIADWLPGRYEHARAAALLWHAHASRHSYCRRAGLTTLSRTAFTRPCAKLSVRWRGRSRTNARWRP